MFQEIPWVDPFSHPIRVIPKGQKAVIYSEDRYQALAQIIHMGHRSAAGTSYLAERLGRHYPGFKSSEANYRRLREKAIREAQRLNCPVYLVLNTAGAYGVPAPDSPSDAGKKEG
jgi:hypothetical protein